MLRPYVFLLISSLLTILLCVIVVTQHAGPPCASLQDFRSNSYDFEYAMPVILTCLVCSKHGTYINGKRCARHDSVRIENGSEVWTYSWLLISPYKLNLQTDIYIFSYRFVSSCSRARNESHTYFRSSVTRTRPHAHLQFFQHRRCSSLMVTKSQILMRTHNPLQTFGDLVGPWHETKKPPRSPLPNCH